MTRKEKQELGENHICNYLELHNHVIIKQNVHKAPHEFDIISCRKGKIYITEVRATTMPKLDYNIVFGKTKALTIIRGAGKHYPEAIIQVAFVLIRDNAVTKVELYPIYLFL